MCPASVRYQIFCILVNEDWNAHSNRRLLDDFGRTRTLEVEFRPVEST